MNKKTEKKEKTGLVCVLLILGLILVLSGNSSAYNAEGGGVCNCGGCVDCSSALNDNSNCYVKVKLTSDIANYALTCINNPANFANKIFDCQGHTIYGDYSGGGSGVVMSYKNNISIKNCVISGFWQGIYMAYSSGSDISNSIINSNLQNGIYMGFSYSSKIADNTINSNNLMGMYIASSANINISNNSANSNSHSGSYLWNASSTALLNNTANSNYYGILLVSSSNNEILNNTANSNSYSGIYLYSSTNNTLKNSTANSNSYGVKLYYSAESNILNNDINKNDFGIFSEKSIFFVENNRINSNGIGIKIDDSYCSMKYNITPDTVLFYHASWCSHCNNMKPWIQQLEQEGYKFHWAEYTNSSAMNVINDCMPALAYGGFPHFGCTSNGKDHLGEFSSKTEMIDFAEECKQDANKHSAVINSNIVCSNIISDFKIVYSLNSSGYNNTCSNADLWNDSGTTGCTYTCPPACPDGTEYDKCSENKPKYCSNGTLIENCSLCGCSDSEQLCNASSGECYTIQVCSHCISISKVNGGVYYADGTPISGAVMSFFVDGEYINETTNTTSSGGYLLSPAICSNGSLVEAKTTINGVNYSKAGILTCNSNLELDLIVTTCSDGTEYNQCSEDKPKYCSDGNLTDKCTFCGCPAGQECNATNENCSIIKGAAVNSNWDGAYLKINVTSPQVVDSALISFNISANLTVGSAERTGFMNGGFGGHDIGEDNVSHIWYQMFSAPGTTGGLFIPITCKYPTGVYEVKLTGANLKNSSGMNITVDTPMPVSFIINCNVCSDGTHYGQCSSNKPKYCSDGNLTDNCELCGCTSGQICALNGSCYIPTCSDGTLYNQCSADEPQYCSDGNLKDNCSQCGCPSDRNCSSDGSCYNPAHLTCVIPGDSDGNCIINIFDVIWAEKIAVGLPGPSGGNAGNADADCNGVVNIFDVVWIERIAVGLPGKC